MKGSCLCGQVAFELALTQLKIYQCHCKECRKQTGTASSCGGVVKQTSFNWLTGQENIGRWAKATGFTSHFCMTCGSSVPNKFRDNPSYWVPAGTLDSDAIVTVTNLFVEEKTLWSNVDASEQPCDKKPTPERLIELLLNE